MARRQKEPEDRTGHMNNEGGMVPGGRTDIALDRLRSLPVRWGVDRLALRPGVASEGSQRPSQRNEGTWRWSEAAWRDAGIMGQFNAHGVGRIRRPDRQTNPDHVYTAIDDTVVAEARHETETPIRHPPYCAV